MQPATPTRELYERYVIPTYARFDLRFARGLDRSKADTFVGMYVNHWTQDYGEQGRAAVRTLLQRGTDAGVITQPVTVEFVD